MSLHEDLVVGRPLPGGDFEAGVGALPFVLPGERIVRSAHQHAARPATTAGGADLFRIVEPSADRVEPRCVHFGVCGGCQYQHAGKAAQLTLKQEVLGGILGGAGLGPLPRIGVTAGEPWGYRNRIRLRVEASPAGLEVGYSERGANRFLPIRMCPIAAPLLWRAAVAVLALAGERGAVAKWLREVEELELFCTDDESALQLQFFLRAAPASGVAFPAVCEALRAQVPELRGAGVRLHPERSRRVRKGFGGDDWGAPGLVYQVAGRKYWVARGAFFQVNRWLVERLVELATAGLAGELAWDLFAGVGLFSQVLAERFRQVVAVEGAAPAAAALGAMRQKGLVAVEAPAQQFLLAKALERDRPEVVVLDPPRAGMGVEGAAALARVRPAQVVYVSCDPTTLARDLAVLVRGGYSIQSIELVDLFPQTFHVETVVRLRQ